MQEIYRATYAPLISLISERVSSDNAIDLAVGRPVEEFRFVIALTYEQLSNRRARHLRAMVLYEPMLVALSDEMPEVDHEEHKTRYRTLLLISGALPEKSRAVRNRAHLAGPRTGPTDGALSGAVRAHSSKCTLRLMD